MKALPIPDLLRYKRSIDGNWWKNLFIKNESEDNIKKTLKFVIANKIDNYITLKSDKLAVCIFMLASLKDEKETRRRRTISSMPLLQLVLELIEKSSKQENYLNLSKFFSKIWKLYFFRWWPKQNHRSSLQIFLCTQLPLSPLLPCRFCTILNTFECEKFFLLNCH